MTAHQDSQSRMHLVVIDIGAAQHSSTCGLAERTASVKDAPVVKGDEFTRRENGAELEFVATS